MMTIFLDVTGIALYATVGYCLARLRLGWAWHVTCKWYEGYSAARQRVSITQQFYMTFLFWPVYIPTSFLRQGCIAFDSWVRGGPRAGLRRVLHRVITSHIDRHIDEAVRKSA